MDYLGIDLSCAVGSLKNGSFPPRTVCSLSSPSSSDTPSSPLPPPSNSLRYGIMKILKHRSVRGLSLIAFELEVVGYTIALAYCLNTGLPFSAYGELVFLLIQAIILVVVIYYFSQPLGISTWIRALLFCAIAPTVLAGQIDPVLFEALYLNLSKSRIFGINVGEEELVSWAKEIGCVKGVFPSEYLGPPLGAKRNSFSMWEPVVQKFYKSLAGWKAKSLSLAGRAVLVKSVLCSLPIYYLSIFRIPSSVLNKLNSIMASFLWGGASDKKNIHWIKWDLVCKPKKLGGLGIPNLLLNRALLGKWVWKFAAEKNSWWKSVLCCVYNLDPNSLMIRNSWTARTSWIWRGIVKNLFSCDAFGDCFRRNLCVRAGNGETFKFWHDVWLGSVPLKDRFPRLFALSNNKEGKVAEFRLHSDAGWVWDIQTRRNLVDWEVEQWLQIISLLNNSSLSLVEEDCWIWLGNGEGLFIAKSCVNAYFDREGNVELESNWERYVWKGIAPPRVESFVWQLAHHRVAVKEELLKRGVTGVEDSFLNLWNVFFVVPGSLMDFFMAWDDLVPRSHIWKFIPRAVLWSVWKCRNEVIFQNGKVDPVLLFFITRFRTVSWFETSVKDVHFHFDSLMGDLKLADQLGNSHKKNLPSSKWSPPPEGFLKVNVDGAMVKDWDKGGIGGLIRDGSGLVLGSFSEKVGGGPPLLAELLAIKRGLILIEEVEIDFYSKQRFILESDSSNALKWINNPILSSTLFQSLVTDIASTVEMKGIITRHISRAANWEADELAKAGIG
ncbi:Mannose-P-dolichol utilization defect 1 protein [Hibiscus syriacus]|uniref:Mannose-P-dolichol utilization defect 1 protein n=1 Tax=Hibiscus syriacus TaxID=106335 RepID=A0A6A2WIS1_HIBSY|nr:Mannose-P-dolichol utilization defect 1 protein [Hibiscus syriacus]